MFDKNYKKAMENVNVDEHTKEKIFDKIMLKEEVNNHKNPAVKWRVAFACAACIAIVLGVLFVPKNTIKENSSLNTLLLKKLFLFFCLVQHLFNEFRNKVIVYEYNLNIKTIKCINLYTNLFLLASLIAQLVKNPPAMQETLV